MKTDKEIVKELETKLEKLYNLINWEHVLFDGRNTHKLVTLGILLGEITQLICSTHSDIDVTKTDIRLEWWNTYLDMYKTFYSNALENKNSWCVK